MWDVPETCGTRRQGTDIPPSEPPENGSRDLGEGREARVGRRRFLSDAGRVGMAGAGIVIGGKIPRLAADPSDPATGSLATADDATSFDRSAATAKGAGPSPAETAWGWLPPPLNRPGSLLVIDTTGLGTDLCVSVAILQGLVNVRTPDGGRAAYLQVPVLPNCFPEEVFNLWPDIYSKQLAIGLDNGTVEDLVKLAQERGVDEYVIWDPSVPATINVATTLAWLRGTAAFGPDAAAGPLVQDLSLSLDLRSFSFKTPADAYQWALDQMAGSAPSTLALVSVGDLPGDPSEGVVNWTVRDYAVGARAFTWSADLRHMTFGGEPGGQLKSAILATVGAGRATMFGWSNDESAQTVLSSRQGLNFVGADTPGLPAANLSVHNAVRTVAVQRPLPRPPRLRKDVVYATVTFTDGDNIGVLIGHHEARWVDPERGKVPVGWSMQGMAPSWTPGIARHYFEAASFNDEMVAWLPFGYPDLQSFVDGPLWQDYVSAAQLAMTGAGLVVSQDLPHRNAVPSELGSGLWQLLHGATAPDGHFIGYQGPPGLYPIGEPLWINGRPVFPTGGYAPSGPTRSALAVSSIANVAAVNAERPLFVVVGLGNCTSYEDAIATVNAHFEVPVRFVLPSQLVRLQRQAWREGLARTTLLGLPVSTNIDPYFLTAGDGHSTPAVFNNNGVITQARYVGDGGAWTYKFNVEGCRSLSLSFTAIGTGSVQATGDDRVWQKVVEVSTAPDEMVEVVANVADVLPASHVWLKFSAGAGSRFALTSLRLTYNAEPRRIRLKTSPLEPGSRLEVPQGPNLLAGVAPELPANVTATVAGRGGSYRLSFQTPPAGVTLTGFGGSTWVTWPVALALPGGVYLFRLEGLTGSGTVYLDVWNGFGDLATREVSLNSVPQVVSLLVALPSEVPAEGLGPQLQVRTYDFPLDVTVTPVVYRVGPAQ
ncbi:MAG: hypothetical protein ACLPSM_12755 [Acidimicrobiales bacterium]